VLGSIWIIRGIAHEIIRGNYQGNLNIYCHKSSVKAIKSICSYVLTKNILKIINNRIKFFKIKDGYKTSLLGKKIEFFDIHSTKDIQFGFQIMLEEEKKLTFLGDEPYRASVKKYCENTDYLLHEAFCLYSQREIYKPYEKHHSTAKDACRNAKVLNVKNIILYHTEDDNLKDRKHFYIQEGKEVFKGNIYMPDDLDVIEISNSNGC
jgi:ribonuclease Z